MAIAICGYARAGKDTTCNWLRDNTTLNYSKSTSEAAAEYLFGLWPGRYTTVEECYKDRSNHRVEWYQEILKYNGETGIRLYSEMVGLGCTVLNGIRDRKEFSSCCEAGLIDLSIWVTREGCHETGSITLQQSDCDLVLHNDGTLEDLYAKLARLSARMGVLKLS